MKLRLNDASVRLRCRRSEVQQFAETGSLETITPFPNGCRLQIVLTAADTDAPSVSFTGERLEVKVPRTAAEAWTSGGDVGIYGHEGSLDILIEKDFRRTSHSSPDESDRYPNPRATA